jgi:hypothetical protein
MSRTENIQEVKTSNDTDHDIEGRAPHPEIRLHVGGLGIGTV